MSNKRLIYGFHALSARLKYLPDSVIEIYLTETRQDERARLLMTHAKAEGVRLHLVEASRLARLTGHTRHQGVVAWIDASHQVASIDDILCELTEPPLLLILDGVTDPHNLGACLRVADCMGVNAVIAPKDRAVGLNATVSKVACGAAEALPYIRVTNLARTLGELKDAGIWIVGTAQEGPTSLFDFTHVGPLAWVMGSEDSGMRRLTRSKCDDLVSIPFFGTVDSLNVSVASGIVLTHSRQERSKKHAQLLP